MTHNLTSLDARREAKKEENIVMRSHVDVLLECSAILANAIEQMQEFAEPAEIRKTLRGAIDALESHGG